MDTKYRLLTSMGDRIRFDADTRCYIEECLSSLDAEEIASAKSENYFNADEMNALVDDMEEAKSRFEDIFSETAQELINNAIAQ
jgi:hypothetical protein